MSKVFINTNPTHTNPRFHEDEDCQAVRAMNGYERVDEGDLGEHYRPCSFCAGAFLSDDSTVEACPECDSTHIDNRVGTGYATDTHSEEAFYCRDCHARFDDPVERPSRGLAVQPSGLAGKLASMDPDDVSADNVRSDHGRAD